MAKQPIRQVTVIHTDGTITVTQEPNPNLERLQKAVGGYIQEIPDFKNYNGIKVNIAYCNKGGKLTGLAPNHIATKAWRDYLDSTGKPYHEHMARLVGPVVIVQSLPKAGA